MKKLLQLLTLSALSMQANASCSDPQVKVQREGIETLIETTYKHPVAKKVGELMPQPTGEKVFYTITYSLNRITREIKKVGLIIGFDRDGDKYRIAEYEFIKRHCDSHMEVKTYAVYDVPHKLLYIDSFGNEHINLVVEYKDLPLGQIWPLIPRCGENETKKGLRT